MNKMKRYLAILLTVLMMINMLPVSAIADTTYSSEWTDAANGVKVVAEGDERTVYNVGITFIYQDLGTMAKEPVIEEVEAGGDLYYDDLPTEPGFVCYMSNDNLDVIGSPISAVSVNDVNEDMALVVVLVPQETDYKVDHSFETANGTYGDTVSEMEKGIVRTMTNAEAKDELGYIPNSFVQEKIEWWDEAQGTGTTVDITYDYIDYTVEYHSEGGSFVNPVQTNVGVESFALGSADLTGYTFAGWYTEADDPETEAVEGTKVGDAGATISGAYVAENANDARVLDLYAHWTAGTASFTINYWKQSADKSQTVGMSDSAKVYDFAGTGSDTAQVGSTVYPTAYFNKQNSQYGQEFFGFMPNRTGEFQTAGVVVKGDGTSVLNVYYDRVTCTIEYKLYSNRSWNTDSSESGLFGQDLTEGQWRTDYNWYNSYRNGSGDGSRCVLLTSFDFETAGYDHYTRNSTTGALTLPFYGDGSTKSRTIYYYNESIEGGFVHAGTAYGGTGTLNMHPKHLGYEPYKYITGSQSEDNVESADWWKTHGSTWSDGTTTTASTVYIACTLVEHTLTYRNYSTENAANTVVDNVKYTTPLDSEYDITPSRPLDKDGNEALPSYYVFDCWCKDEALEVPFVFDGSTKMPNAGYILYARWVPEKYDVIFHDNYVAEGAAAEDTSKIEDVLGGTYLTEAQINAVEPTRPGYDFMGWYTNEALTTPFTIGTPIIGDENDEMHIYAKWEQKTYLDFTVYYVKQGTPDSALKDSANWVRNPDQMRAPMQDKIEGTDSGYVTVAAKDPTVENYTTWIYDEPFKTVDVSRDPGTELYQVFYYRQPQKEYYQVRYYYVDDAGVTHYVKIDDVKNNATTTSSGVESYKYSILEKLTPPTGFTCAPYTYITRFNADASNPAQTDVEVKLAMTTVTGTKTWVDSSNAYATRPANTTIELVKAGAAVDTHVLATSTGTENSESFSWTKPTYDITYRDCDGKTPGTYVDVAEIAYSVREAGVTNNVLPGVGAEYAVSYDGNNITNTLTGGAVDVTVTKIWDDNGNATKQRPATVTINLYGVDKNTAAESKALSADDASVTTGVTENGDATWTYTFKDVAKFANGALISYTVDESAAVVNYTTGNPVKVSDNDNNWTITNSIKTGTLIIDKKVTGLPTGVANSDEFTFKVTTAAGVEYIAKTDAATVDGNVTIEGVPAGSYVVTEIDDSENWAHEYVMPAAGTAVTVLAGAEVTAEVVNAVVDKADSITVTKNWNDASNQDGKRPEDLTFTLKSGEFEYTVSGTQWKKEGNTWTAELKDTVRLYSDGENSAALTYTVTESDPNTVEGAAYTQVSTSFVPAEVKAVSLTNVHTPATTEVSGTKTWVDEGTVTRPTSVTVNLLADGKVIDTTTATKEGGWTYSFTNLPVYQAGKVIAYTVAEANVDSNYVPTVDANDNITNTVKTGTLVITKDVTGLPEGLEKEDYFVFSVTSTMEDATYGVAETKAIADGGEIIIENVPVGKYTVAEIEKKDEWKHEYVTAESMTVEVKAGETTTVPMTNAAIDKADVVTVTKVWDDASNQDGKRPADLTVTLSYTNPANAEESYTYDVTLSGEGDTWSDTIEKTVRLYNNAGEAIKYSVTESDPNTNGGNYNRATAEFTPAVAPAVTLTNKHEPAQTTFTITKQWDDGSNVGGIRPASIDVQLYKTVGENTTAVGEPVTVNGSGDIWTYKYNKLPVYENGIVIAYSVKEVGTTVTDGVEYLASIEEGRDYVVTYPDAKTIVNSYDPDDFRITVTAEKKWVDNNVEVADANVTVNKVGAQLYQKIGDGEFAPYKDEAVLTKDATTGEYAYTWSNLPKYTLVEGTWVENAWQIKESTVPAGWLNDGKAVDADGTKYALSATLVNTREYAAINAQKTWNDADNAANLRPASGDFTIDLVNGDTTYTFTFDANLTGNVWTSNNTLSVPTYELTGTQIVYTLAEADAVVTNYTMAPANWTADASDKTVEVSNTIKGGQSLTVTKEVTYTTPDGLTEDTNSTVFDAVDFTFTVTTANGTPVSGVPYTKTTADGTETGTLTNGTFTLKHGEQITISGLKVGTYTVVETDAYDFTCVDAEQSANVSETAQTLNFTNKRDVTTEEEAITLKKNWKDAGDPQRGESLTLKLVGRAGEDVVYSAALTLTKNGNWTMDVAGLPKTLNNVAIAYELVEENVPNGYKQIDDDKAYEVTNVRTGTDDVVFTKTWNDDLTEARRPADPAAFAAEMLTLSDDEQSDLSAKVPSITVDEEKDVWTFTYSGMEMFDDEGNVIVYTLSETLKGNTATWYTADKAVATWNYNSSADNGLVNTLKTVTVTVEKDVVDETGEDYSNTEFAITANASYASVASTSNMAEKAESLKDGGSFTYEVPFGATVTVAEDETAWTESFSANNGTAFEADGTITVTNTRTLIDNGITVTKIWDDANDQDGVRPASVAMTLMQNGKAYTTNPAITAKVDVTGTTNTWTYTWTGMPMYDQDGELYTYTVVEDAVEGYTADSEDKTADEANNWTITNTHEVELTEVTVTKVWNDADDQDGKRPESVEITLYDDGVALEETAVLNAANDWTYIWNDLPVNNANTSGKLDGSYEVDDIAYTVKETKIGSVVVAENETEAAEYTIDITGTQATGYVVTNSHDIDLTTVTVTKVWDDVAAKYGSQPASVTVQLLDDGEACGAPVVLNADNEWTYTWRDLPVNNATDTEDAMDGTYEASPIVYTVIETKIGEVAVAADADSAAGYDIAITGDQKTGYTVTNTRETYSLTAGKVWSDDSNHYELRPTEAVSYTLYRYSAAETVVPVEVVTMTAVTEGNEQPIATWNELPAYDNAGNAYTYYIVEADVTNYNASNNGSDNATTLLENEVITITNSLDDNAITVFKSWDETANVDEGVAGYIASVRPDMTFTLTNTDWAQVNETKNLSGAAEKYEVTFDYVAKSDAYELAETMTNGDGFSYTETITPVYDETTGIVTGFTVVNKLDTMNVTVEKSWLDNDIADLDHPNATFQLIYVNKDGVEKIVKTVSTPTPAEGDTYKFENVPARTDYIVREVEMNGFTVVENDQEVEDGAAAITNKSKYGAIKIQKVVDLKDTAWDRTYNPVFTFNYSFTDLDGTLVEGTREVTVKLTEGETTGLSEQIVAPLGAVVTIDEIFVENPGADDALAIEWVEPEDAVTVTVEDTAADESIALVTTPFTNTREFLKNGITVTKNWNDLNGDKTRRPENVTFTLYYADENGAAAGIVPETIVEENPIELARNIEVDVQSVTFAPVPVNANGYVVVETMSEANEGNYVDVDGDYTEFMDYNVDSASFTNKATEALVTVKKTIEDNTIDSNDGMNSKFVYSIDGGATKSAAIGNGDDEKVVFEVVIGTEYTLTEYNADGSDLDEDDWTAKYEGEGVAKTANNTATFTADEGLEEITVTNTRNTVELTLQKSWVDNNNEQETRPTVNVIVESKQDGEFKPVYTQDEVAVRYDNQIVDETADFEVKTFNGATLPKTALNGEPIEYRVNEEVYEVLKDAEYEQASIVVNGNVTTVVNQLKTGSTEFGFTKVWVDNGDEQKIRPAASVAGYGAWLTLYQSVDQQNWTALTTAATTVAVAGGNTDAYAIKYTGLDRFDEDGKLYYYAVAETIPAEGTVSDYKQDGATIAVADGVKAVAPNGTLINTLTGETVDVTITKYWKDGDGNTLEVIPVETLYVALTRKTVNDTAAEGFKGGYTSLTGGSWTTTLSVDKYDDDGALYVFDVVEYDDEAAYNADKEAWSLTGAVDTSATFAKKTYTVTYSDPAKHDYDLTITNVRGDDPDEESKKEVTKIDYHTYVVGEGEEAKKVDVGDSWTYTITWTNNTNKEQVVTITDTLESYLTVSGTTAAFDVTAKAEIAGAAATVEGQKVEWKFTAKPFHNGIVTLTVTLNALPNAEGEQIAENTANVYIGNDEDITNTPTVELADPDFTVEKEVLNEKVAYALGDTVEYKVTVTNTGNITLFNLNVLDKVNLGNADEAIQVEETIAALQPGADNAWTQTYSYVVTENDLERSKIYNKVTVNCIDPTSEEQKPMDERSDDETVQTVQMAPAIAVEKKVVDNRTVEERYYTEGETVTFEITVSNTGNRTLYDVTLTDSMSNGGIVEVAESDAYTVSTNEDGDVVITLAEPLEPAVVNEANSTFTFQVTYDVTREDLGGKKITNFVTAEGTTEDNDTVTDDDEAEASFTTDKLIIYTITKVWNDDDNALGVRPETVTVQLYRNGEAYDDAQEIKADENGQWTVTYPNLPYTDADHVKFDYTVKETYIGTLTVNEELKGYTVGYSGETVVDGVSEAITITNTLETVDVTVVKEWVDAEGNPITDTTNDIPKALTMALTNDQKVVSGIKDKADADKKEGAVWTYEFNNLPLYDADCNELVYTVTEGETVGYTPVEGIVDRALTVAIDKEKMTGTATFVNVKADEPITPPEKDMVEDSTPTVEVMLGDDSENMAVDGSTVTYTIAWSNNYATTREVVVTDILPVGLTYVADSGSNADTDNGKAIDTTISQDGQKVIFTFEAKPFQDGVITLTVNVDREAIIKAAEESGAYDPTVENVANMIIEGDEVVRESNGVTTSVYNPIITVDKSIIGESHNANGYQVGETIEYQVVVTNDGNVPLVDIMVEDTLVAQSTETFDLDIGESKEFNYTYVVTAEDVAAGKVDNTFTATGKPDAVTDEGEAVEEVSDSDSETAITYEAEGSWIPEDEAGTILKTIEGAELTEGQFQFTITDVTNGITINGTNGADGVVTFDEAFEYTLEDMPTYDNFEETNPGAVYTGTFTYELVEVNTGDENVDYTNDKYTFVITYTDNGEGVLEITKITMNGEEYNGETITFDNYKHIDAVVTKTWENVGLIDVPEVTITLYRKVLGADETVPTKASAIDDTWTVIGSKVIAEGKAEWTNLERVDADANDGVYTYIATESVAANADAAFTASAEVVELSAPVNNVKSAGFTNSRDMGSAEEANLSVTKTVVNNDGELTDEMESDKFDFTVIVPSDMTVGDTIAYTIGEAEFTATIQSGDAGKFFVIEDVKHGETASVTTQLPTGTYTVSEQPESGNAYNYTVACDDADKDVVKNGTVAFEFTNTSNSNGFSIGKLWKQPNGGTTATAFDYDTEAVNTATFGLFYDAEGTKPVKQNGVNLVAVTDENGIATFNDVAYSTGAVYYIKEISTTVEDSYIINTAAVKVEWDGEKFAVAAQSVTNELQTRELTIVKTIDWAGTIKESTSFDINFSYVMPNGETVTGYVTASYDAETDATTYTTTIGETTTDGNVLTVPYGTEVTVDEQPNDAWTKAIAGLDAEQAFATVSEDKEVEVTNTRVLTTLSFTKVWVDDSNALETRPETITVEARRLTDGEYVAVTGDDNAHGRKNEVLTVAAEDSTEYDELFAEANLPKYDIEGNLHDYIVAEPDAVIAGNGANYDSVVDGATVTNTLTQETVTVSGTKTWNMIKGEKTPDITVRLYRDGVEIASKTIENATGYTFDNLPKYAVGAIEDYEGKYDGHRFTYSVSEDAINGYTSVNEGVSEDNTAYVGENQTNFTNTADETKVLVTKKWIDGDGVELAEDLIPESLTIQLKRNGEDYLDAVKLTVAKKVDLSTWQYEFTGLPTHDELGVAYTYAVEEEQIEGFTAKALTVDVKDEKAELVNTKDTVDAVDPTKEDTAVTESHIYYEGENGEKREVVVGAEITYTITYTNNNNTREIVTITDKVPTGTEFVKASDEGALVNGVVTWKLDVAPFTTDSVTVTFRVTEAALDGAVADPQIENTASVQIGDAPEVNAEAEDIAVYNPELDLEKTVENRQEVYKLGDTIEYKVVVTNTGNVTLTDVEVTDNRVELTSDMFAAATGATYDDETKTVSVMKPGDEVTFTYTVEVTEEIILEAGNDVVNVAAAKADDPYTEEEDQSISDTDTETVVIEEPNPSIDVEKTTTNNEDGARVYKLGEEITYEIVVTNDGNMTLTDVEVKDELIEKTWTIETMIPGETKTFTGSYTVTEDDLYAGSVVNVATAKGDDPTGTDPDDDDEVEDPTEEPDPSFTVVKTLTNLPERGYFVLGETAKFDITVTNTGNLTLNNITVNEELEGAAFIVEDIEGVTYTGKTSATIASLAPRGDKMVLHAEYTIKEADLGKTENLGAEDAVHNLKNTLTAEGTPYNPDPENPDPIDPDPIDPEPIPVDEVTTVTVNKIWDDQDNAFETRQAITVYLISDGNVEEPWKTATIEADEEGNWSYTFVQLPVHNADAEEIVYTVVEEAVPGYDTEYSEAEDGSLVITNTLQQYTLTVRYWYEQIGGKVAAKTFTRTYFYGEGYNVVSPKITGYRADKERVSGIITEDTEYDVIYKAINYRLTIYYVYEDGTTAAPTYIKRTMNVGDDYDVVSPTIEGYVPNVKVVSDTMPAHNMVYTVIYVPATVVIDEYGVPLNIGSVVMNVGDCFE